MPSLFPELFAYQFFAPTVLRIVLGVILITYGARKCKKSPGLTEDTSLETKQAKLLVKATAVIEVIVGALLIIGFLTQLAVVVASLVFVINIIIKSRERTGFIRGYDFEIILLAVSLSLFLLGPGAFSIDLPL